LEQATETCMRSKLNLPIFTDQSRHLNLFMFNNIFMSRLILLKGSERIATSKMGKV